MKSKTISKGVINEYILILFSMLTKDKNSTAEELKTLDRR